MGQRIRQAEVNVRAEGSDGYTVVYSPPIGPPRNLQVFAFAEGQPVSATRVLDRKATRRAADAYRDGVARGLALAADALDAILQGTP